MQELILKFIICETHHVENQNGLHKNFINEIEV